MFERAVLVHYHEIGLKGRNRSAFENRLRINLDHAVAGLTEARTELISSRLLVPVTDHSRAEELIAVVARVPGVSYVGDALVTSRELPEMERAAKVALDAAPPGPFRVEARRSNTDHPMSSMEMNAEIGRYLVERTQRPVDLSNPSATVNVEVVQGQAYIYARRVQGPGGLPVGTAGRMIALLSAGIDSPVAAWRMMKRGAVVIGVHFSGVPQTSDLSARLVQRIGEALEPVGGLGRVYTVPFGDLQRRIALASPPDLRVLLYRRLMVRVAERIAATERAKALVTGESLGQVASQTLDNIAVVDAVADMPLLRPLIGMDKNEIITQARCIGTFDISTEKHEDCCTLFMPRTPATHATVAEAEAGEADLDIDAMVDEAVASATHVDFRCPAYKKRKAAGAERAGTEAAATEPTADAAKPAAEGEDAEA